MLKGGRLLKLWNKTKRTKLLALLNHVQSSFISFQVDGQLKRRKRKLSNWHKACFINIYIFRQATYWIMSSFANFWLLSYTINVFFCLLYFIIFVKKNLFPLKSILYFLSLLFYIKKNNVSIISVFIKIFFAFTFLGSPNFVGFFFSV